MLMESHSVSSFLSIISIHCLTTVHSMCVCGCFCTVYERVVMELRVNEIVVRWCCEFWNLFKVGFGLWNGECFQFKAFLGLNFFIWQTVLNLSFVIEI